MSDHVAIVRAALSIRNGETVSGTHMARLEAAHAALDALVAERDDADLSAQLSRDATAIWKARAEAAEAEVARLTGREVDAELRAAEAEAEVARLNHENAALEAEGRTLREALAPLAEYVETHYPIRIDTAHWVIETDEQQGMTLWPAEIHAARSALKEET